MLSKEKERDLKLFAAKIRLETMRAIVGCGRGHIGGAMSMVETLAVLYGAEMSYDVARPRMESRDRFVLSKGHAGPGLYATLALCGFFPMKELKTINKPGTILPSHCDMTLTPGVDMSSGALGQGISAAIGMALAARLTREKYNVYCMLGDGECDEGQVWEGVMMAAQQKLDNLIVFIDNNKEQLDGPLNQICDLGSLEEKFAAFNWYTQRVDGQDVRAIYDAIEAAKAHEGQPCAIVLDTVKGAGCEVALRSSNCHCMDFLTEKDAETGWTEVARLEQAVQQLGGEA